VIRKDCPSYIGDLMCLGQQGNCQLSASYSCRFLFYYFACRCAPLCFRPRSFACRCTPSHFRSRSFSFHYSLTRALSRAVAILLALFRVPLRLIPRSLLRSCATACAIIRHFALACIFTIVTTLLSSFFAFAFALPNY
jgi:hypothetical protein